MTDQHWLMLVSIDTYWSLFAIYQIYSQNSLWCITTSVTTVDLKDLEINLVLSSSQLNL